MDNSFDTSSGKVAICVEKPHCGKPVEKRRAGFGWNHYCYFGKTQCEHCKDYKRYRPLSSSELEELANTLGDSSSLLPYIDNLTFNNKPVKLVAMEG
jgi:hypothetical protein